MNKQAPYQTSCCNSLFAHVHAAGIDKHSNHNGAVDSCTCYGEITGQNQSHDETMKSWNVMNIHNHFPCFRHGACHPYFNVLILPVLPTCKLKLTLTHGKGYWIDKPINNINVNAISCLFFFFRLIGKLSSVHCKTFCILIAVA